MQTVYYDLHIHSALSPCADKDMLPCDIAGMAYLNGLDVIAVTDHNSYANVKAVMEAAEIVRIGQGLDKSLIVIAGAEITTAEEVHVLCLFDTFEKAQHFESELSACYSKLQNRADVFGEQLIAASNDSIIGRLDRMLMAPASISFDNLFMLTREHSGAFVPAHIDRDSFSVISNLGFLPPDLDIAAVEVSPRGVAGGVLERFRSEYPGKKFITSSDAHQLHVISEKTNYMTLPELSAKAVVDYLRFPLKNA